MKNLILISLLYILILNNYSTYSFYISDYEKTSINEFINSPSKDDLDEIVDATTGYCEQIYLEATRRRDYTEIELAICSDLFAVKRQQELDYITYMLKNRGVY